MRLFTILFLASGIASLANAVDIAYNDPRIEVDGALIVKDTGSSLHFQRFTDYLHARQRADGSNITKAFYNDLKAASASGVLLRFTTSSPTVQVHLNEIDFQSRAPQLGIIQNGDNDNITEFNPGSNPGAFTLLVDSVDPGNAVTYEVVLPSWANVDFTGLTLADGYDLADNPVEDKPIYAAFGDSITHGTGQGCKAYQTYPFRLAEANGWQLFNFAIGGSTTTPEIADVLDETVVTTWANGKPDIITILWGYNDCQNKSFTLDDYRARYTAFLADVLAHCPEARVFCIKPTATTDPEGATVDGVDKHIDHYRDMVEAIVLEFQSEGHDRLYLIDGQAITKEDELLDAVHFTPEGAQTIADELDKAINSVLNGGLSLNDWLQDNGLTLAQLEEDENHNGLPNALEFLMSENPSLVNTDTVRPGLQLSAGNQLAIHFERPYGVLDDGVSVTLQGSANLVDWDPVASTLTTLYQGNGVWRYAYQQTASIHEGGLPYVRLQISVN
ncbi:SGNH/GDSL hydrolase family protein [Cerasicoccus fimbriatus]|uniref:SGNH/GDSL hydrolase family protein n=1 Tax=Cerasicoccus fimbriatus TaxID=3014554 RepID=UPI0022B56C9B|nr:SGNH/GDSL hydrolase family protein [Cerasicoccus sp. TK19100]